MARDTCVGPFLVIEESCGDGVVYDQELEDHPDPVHEAGSFDEALDWAREESQLREDEKRGKAREPKTEFAKKPCKQCPFRKKSMPGWLGASTPEGFISTMLVDDEVLPCHSTIDYEQPGWEHRWAKRKEGKACAGAAALAANHGHELKRKPDQIPDAHREQVFGSFGEFVNHHRKLPIGSWDEPARGTPESRGVHEVRKHLGLPVLTDGKRQQ